ncbi:MAG: 3-dehydroquinate synthase [Armatimonadetes bacterium]|nr:3-dehydroquinate synthase [Armatimonadota bacterium]
MDDVRVELGDRSYSIAVGSGNLATSLDAALGALSPTSVHVVTHPMLWRRYRGSLGSCAACAEPILIPSGERHKTLRTVASVLGALAERKADRRCVVVALGGGVVGDMAGFAAACYLRGVRFVQVPTTLLAQVDASVGGKTGVDLPQGKNLVGSFHQPSAVVIDTQTLATLPTRCMRSGIAEILKHGIIADAAYFEFVAARGRRAWRPLPDWLEPTVAQSCRMKAHVVSQDEREGGLRAVLNFGHTVGHAIETLTGYRRLSHGEAVAVGMVTAALVGESVCGSSGVLVERIIAGVSAYGLPWSLPQCCGDDEIVRVAMHDKKTSGGVLRMALAPCLGRAIIAPVDAPVLLDALRRHRSLGSSEVGHG